MIQAVFEDGVALPDQRRDSAEVGHVAVGKQQGARATGQFGQRFFELMMRRAVADDQMRCTAAHAPALGASTPRGDDFRVIGQAQVIVITERQQRLTIDHHFRALRALQQRAMTVELFSATSRQTRAEIERHAGLVGIWGKPPCRSQLVGEAVSQAHRVECLSRTRSLLQARRCN